MLSITITYLLPPAVVVAALVWVNITRLEARIEIQRSYYHHELERRRAAEAELQALKNTTEGKRNA